MQAGAGKEDIGECVSTSATPLFCEELADIGERFELKSVSCGIEKEHRSLFADLSLETNVRLDDEGSAGTTESLASVSQTSIGSTTPK